MSFKTPSTEPARRYLTEIGKVALLTADQEVSLARRIELRFGLKGERPHSLEEVGQKFGLTRERIRQIEAKTVAKLSSYRDSQRLREFLD